MPSLTGLRFVAALMVFVYHSSIQQVIGQFRFADARFGNDYRFAASNLGWCGVSFFFILSGFMLTWSTRGDDRPRLFWRRRAVKILPNHVITFLAAAVLMDVVINQPFAGRETVTGFFLLNSWVPVPSFIMLSVNPPSWTLVVEMFCYACFPLFILGIRRIRPERLWFWAAGFMAAIILVTPLAKLLLPSSPQYPMGFPSWHSGHASWLQLWFVTYFPVTRALEFVLGMIVARIVMSDRWIRITIPRATALLVVGYLVALYAPISFLFTFVACTAIPLALLIGAVATADLTGRKSPFASPVMVRLGEISFALYLVHWSVLMALQQVIRVNPGLFGHLSGPLLWSTPVAAMFVVVSLALSLILAWTLYRLVEEPAMRRWSRPRPQPLLVPERPQPEAVL